MPTVHILEMKDGLLLMKEQQQIGACRFCAQGQQTLITDFSISESWRRRGYGTYLAKELLRRTGGYAKENGSLHQLAVPPQNDGEAAFWQKMGFAPAEGTGAWLRRHTVDLSAVKFAQEFLAGRLAAPTLCVDATCGNGGDTEFLCRLVGSKGQVLAMDIQPQAIQATRARLQQAGVDPAQCSLVCGSHADLLQYVQPGTADAVMFNFGWLPGAEHQVFSTAESSIPALQAALTALRSGGILSAVLYSGKVIGSDEKQAVLHWLRTLPLRQYTVLVCEFANWAETAPLPCFVMKK